MTQPMTGGAPGGVELHVAFQDGFDGDRALVAVAGRRVEASGLTTRTQIGLADEVHVSVPAGTQTVTVSLPDRGIEASSTHELSGETWLAVNVEADRLDLRWSETQLWYA